MSVDSVNESQARFLAQKRKELENEQNSIETETARARRDGIKQATAEREKIDKELVAISKAGEKQAESLRSLNSERIRGLDTNHQQSFLKLSETTAADIKRIEADSLKAINDHKASSMEKIQSLTSRSEDPFYRIKSLGPVMSEAANEFQVKVALPEHEAQNLFVSAEGQQLKLSLARRYQDKSDNAESGVSTKTSSYQTVMESLNLPAPITAKGIKRSYADGIVTITVPKAGVFPHSGEA